MHTGHARSPCNNRSPWAARTTSRATFMRGTAGVWNSRRIERESNNGLMFEQHERLWVEWARVLGAVCCALHACTKCPVCSVQCPVFSRLLWAQERHSMQAVAASVRDEMYIACKQRRV